MSVGSTIWEERFRCTACSSTKTFSLLTYVEHASMHLAHKCPELFQFKCRTCKDARFVTTISMANHNHDFPTHKIDQLIIDPQDSKKIINNLANAEIFLRTSFTTAGVQKAKQQKKVIWHKRGRDDGNRSSQRPKTSGNDAAKAQQKKSVTIVYKKKHSSGDEYNEKRAKYQAMASNKGQSFPRDYRTNYANLNSQPSGSANFGRSSAQAVYRGYQPHNGAPQRQSTDKKNPRFY